MLLQSEKFFLELRSALVAPETVGGHHTVAGGKKPDGIFAAGPAHGPGGAGSSQGQGKLAVGPPSAVGNGVYLPPDRQLKGGAPGPYRQVKGPPAACKILADLPLNLQGQGIRRGRSRGEAEPQTRHCPALILQIHRAKGRFKGGGPYSHFSQTSGQ